MDFGVPKLEDSNKCIKQLFNTPFNDCLRHNAMCIKHMEEKIVAEMYIRVFGGFLDKKYRVTATAMMTLIMIWASESYFKSARLLKVTLISVKFWLKKPKVKI